MATFYYYPNATLHLCNQLLSCTEESFNKLMEKGKITTERFDILHTLQKYRALTLEMLSHLFNLSEDKLHEELDALMEYGLVIKQFYEANEEGESIRTPTFYCASPSLPAKAVLPDKKNDFTWSKTLFIGDAMTILAFNQFHLSLVQLVPHKAIQAQMQYVVRGEIADGRYRLKSKRFMLGYSHLFVLAVRDFADHNLKIVEKLKKFNEAYAYSKEKMPWFILICENKYQCCQINQRLQAEPGTRNMFIYYLLDTDLEYGDNPLLVLQTYRFANEEQETVSETYRIDPWYD